MGDAKGPSMLLTKGDHRILVCIGKNCYVHQTPSWKFHSELTRVRQHAIPISMPNGVYLFGGSGEKLSETTSSFMAWDQNKWINGIRIPKPGITYQVILVKIFCIILDN